MEKKLIDYGERINKALLQVTKDILFDLSEYKISSNHCFYITFNTTHPDVVISQKLKKEYPKEITIVIQNQFWDLKVEKNSFNVTLSFNRKKEMLCIPFESISKFNDPFVKFSLQLEFKKKETTSNKFPKKIQLNKKKESSKIITLEKFRKKKDE